jgi:para-nitrobenzyl esterase
MSSYWANFAKNGDPNGNGLPQWPAYNTTDKKITVLDEHPHPETIPDKESLDFLYIKASGKPNKE